MKARIQDSWQPITIDDVRRFETLIGANLPADYRDFLLARNGGRFPDNVRIGEKVAGVELIYGLNTGFSYSDLEWNFRTFALAGRMPKGFVPIGSDSGSCQLCLRTTGRKRGEVWYWSYYSKPEEYDDDPVYWENMRFMTRSFGDFLEILEAEPEPAVSSLPIFQAAELGDVDQLRRLLDSGVDVNCRSPDQGDDNQSLLMTAVYFGRLEAVHLLISRGADAHAIDARGWPVAFYTCLGIASPDALQLLLDAGVSPNDRAPSGEEAGLTVLMWAVRCAAWQIPRVLIAAGADVNAVNFDGQSVLRYCEEHGHDEFLPILRSAGAA